MKRFAARRIQPYLYYNLGVLLHRINRRSEARTEYKLAITVFEDQAKIALAHAGLFSGDGDPVEALRSEHRRATLLRKNEAEAYNALGALAHAEGHAGKARAAYAAAMMHDPDLLVATYNLGILDARKVPDTAIGLWGKVLAKDKDYLLAHERLAEALRDSGEIRRVGGRIPRGVACAAM